MMKLGEVMSIAMHTAMEVTSEAQTHDAAPVAGSQNTVATRDPGNESSTVTQGAATPPPPNGSPAADARAAAATNGDPLASLKNDADYQETCSQLEFFQSIKQGFYLIDQQFGGDLWTGLSDGKINMGNIQAAAGDASAPGYEVAKKLLQHPELLVRLLDGGDYSGAKLDEVITSLKGDKSTKEASARSDAAGAAAKHPDKYQGESFADRHAGVESGDAANGQKPPVEDPTKLRPFTSDKTDPMDRSADAISFMQSEIDRLTNEMTNTQDPGKMKAIEAQISKASTLMQMLMSSMQQQQQLMSNIAKMWSDMAMAAIRNTH